MTLTSEPVQSFTPTPPAPPRDQPSQRPAESQSVRNVGSTERAVSVAAGAILALQGLSRGSLPGLVVAGVGGALLYRGATGQCGLYKALAINTSESTDGQQGEAQRRQRTEQNLASHGTEVAVSFIIDKPAEELYQFWRKFDNLPTVMTHLKSVRVIDERRSHWVAQAPRIYGDVEWDAEITADEPNSRITWQSISGGDVDTRGEIRFEKALGDRGTNVHVTLEYVPPAGKLGHWIATLTGNGPQHQVREDLRNFKRLMEVGELPTTKGQPVGSCGM